MNILLPGLEKRGNHNVIPFDPSSPITTRILKYFNAILSVYKKEFIMRAFTKVTYIKWKKSEATNF